MDTGAYGELTCNPAELLMHLPLFQSKAVIKPLFELCGDGDDIKSQYYLFGKQFEYWFYTAWCANQVRFR